MAVEIIGDVSVRAELVEAFLGFFSRISLDSFLDASLKTTAKSIDSFEQSRYAKFSVQFDNTPGGNHPYDFRLTDDHGAIRVQVKMQRQKSHRPMMASEGSRFLPPDMYVVETQKTRRGSHPTTGEDTRPYKFDEFDILAVALHPSTGDWSRYLYMVNSWLVPRSDDTNLMFKYQPVPKQANENWTDSFLTCVSWFRSGQSRRLPIDIPRTSRRTKRKTKRSKKRKPR